MCHLARVREAGENRSARLVWRLFTLLDVPGEMSSCTNKCRSRRVPLFDSKQSMRRLFQAMYSNPCLAGPAGT